MSNLYDDYESLMDSISQGRRAVDIGQSNPVQSNDAFQNGERFGSFASQSSHLGSENNFDDFNDAVSSLNSGILSPYSTGSSPDGFFLSATNSNVDSQYSGEELGFDNDMVIPEYPQDILYPQNFNPVPMQESVSNSTVTFNNNDNNLNSFNQPKLNPVKEEEESPESINKEAPISKTDNNNLNDNPPLLGKKIKSSHNLIEKKYRTNINSKIIELRNCVPALRILVAKSGNHRTRSQPNESEVEDDYYEGNGYTDDEDKLDGLKPAKKLNKATILAKASEYIKHLERKNDVLQQQNNQLQTLLDASTSASASAGPSLIGSSQPGQYSIQPSPFNNSNSSESASNWVSPINNQFTDRSLSGQQNQVNNQQQFPNHQSLTNKILLGGMGVMLGASSLDDFSNSYNENSRGLFALPIFSIGNSSSALNVELFKPLLGLTKILFCLGIFYYHFISPMLYYSNNKERSGNQGLNTMINQLINIFTFLMSASSDKIENRLITNMENSLQFSDVLVYIKCLFLAASPKNYLLKSIYSKKLYGYLASNKITSALAMVINCIGQRYWVKAGSYAGNNETGIQNLTRCDYYKFDFTKCLNLGLKHSKKSQLVDILLAGLIEQICIQSLINNIKLENKNKGKPSSSEIADLKFNIESNISQISCLAGDNDEINLKCAISSFFAFPNQENINQCYVKLKKLSENGVTISNSTETGFICAVIKYSLLNNPNDYENFNKWFSKLIISNVGQIGGKGNLDLFSFVSCYLLFSRLDLENIEQMENYFKNKLDYSDEVSIDSIEVDEIMDADIKNRIFNMVVNMRVYIGDENNSDAKLLGNSLVDNIIEELLLFIGSLSGF
ncbi:hypothetical protein DAMA08_002970 [Martiniozyma asiatica (nom. inval.)]|nr:hypothetical protein DAMA08_002970 [Martiniozyma asiatica]